MKKILIFLCVLSIVLTCGFSLCSASQAENAEENNVSIIDWFSNSSNYLGHQYGSFGGASLESNGSVRILAKPNRTSENHIGFMLKKEAIESMVDEGYKTVSFKITTQAY